MPIAGASTFLLSGWEVWKHAPATTTHLARQECAAPGGVTQQAKELIL